MILAQNHLQLLNGNNYVRIKTFISIILIYLVGGLSANAQNYKTHKVVPGETVYSISKKYNVSEETIYRLNPDAKQGLSVNTLIILPSNDIISSNQIKFKKHRVKRKETLFSISQLYNVSVDDIKKFNKELYSRQLKKGEKIQIPIGLSKIVGDNSNLEANTSDGGKHTVIARETKFGIARKYGITIAELEGLNPNMGPNLQIGTILNVPSEAIVDSAIIQDENFEFYEVLPKEGFFRLKIKLGLTQEDIIALNPYAKDGLKEGMILKIPKEAALIAEGASIKVNLEEYIINRSKKNIALMLPFHLKNIDGDSVKNNVNLLRENGAMRVALDFYSGVLMATEFAKDKGISTHLQVFDTKGSVNTVGNIITRNDFNNIDAVIGPLLQKNVEKAAADLKRTDTPVFSPLSNREIRISSNLFQTLPTDKMLEKAMLGYLKANANGKNVVIISDAKRNAQKLALLEVIPGAKTLSPREKGFLYTTDLESKLDENNENWVILESDNPVILSNVVGLLNGMPEETTIRLFTLNKNDSYDYHDVSNMHLARLGFTFPSVSKSYDFNDKNAFLVSYKNNYGVLPNRYAVRGFDVTYDVLLRLASADNVYKANDSKVETEYIENKFRYVKKLLSGYENNALYIIKYTDDLQFEVVQ